MSRTMGTAFGILAVLCLGAAVAPALAQEDSSPAPISFSPLTTAPAFGYGDATLTYQYQCSCGYGYGYSSPSPSPAYYPTYSPPPPVEPTFPIPVDSPPPPAYPSSPAPAPTPAPYYYPPVAPTYPAYPTYTYPTYPTYVYDAAPAYFGYGYSAYGAYGLSDSTLPPSTDPELSSASFTAATDPVSLAAANATLAPGTCYCPYDSDWSSWAISATPCRAALYRRCKFDSRLPCAWLDQFYGSSPPANSTAAPSRPHEADISDYLYNDCPPAPPCKCADEAALAKTATGTPSYSCCKQLTTYSRVPFSGLSESAAEAACQGFSPSATPGVRAWIQRQLWHAQCPAAASASQALYRVVDDPLLRTSRQGPSSGNKVAGKAGIIGGLVGLGALAVLAAAGAYVYRQRRAAAANPNASPLLP